ncbi:hypothetical protein G9A89_012878 [Geosiphon pyriformis]|nr:hypothetical protein G9A89_012878 [Geosiphon pyriformis]
MSKGKRRKTSTPESNHGSPSLPFDASSSNNIYEFSHKRKKLCFSLDSNHASNCEDSTCTGCAVGEIELDFTEEVDSESHKIIPLKPTPVQLYTLAVEEVEKEASDERGGGVAKKLYETALEEFEKLLENSEEEAEKEGVSDKEKSKATSSLDTTGKLSSKQLKYHYAMCCLSFGQYLQLLSYKLKALGICEKLVRIQEDYAESWIGIGYARIALAQHDRESQFKELSNEEEPDIIHEDELNHYEVAIESFDKGVSIYRRDNEKKFSLESIRIARCLQKYAIAMNISTHQVHAKNVYTHAIKYLRGAYDFSSDKKNMDDDGFVLGLWGSCLFYLARLTSAKQQDEDTLITIDDAIQKLRKAGELDQDGEIYQEILGHAYMLKASIELLNEEEALEAYDIAVEQFLKAYERNPNNQTLKKQIECLGLLDSEPDEKKQEKDQSESETEQQESE